MSDSFPDARWGDHALPDWRKAADDPDPDDELLTETPADVVAMLGFDPLEFEDSGETEDEPIRSDVRIDADEPPLGQAPTDQPTLMHAAGLLLIHNGDGGDRVLFVHHKDRGTWELPGGEIKSGESAEDAAVREVSEEVGATPYGRVSLLMRNTLTGVDYSTFIAHVHDPFDLDLERGDGELDDWMWAAPTQPPEPVHPGVRLALARLRMNELDVARSIASGEFSSPQQYENIWLFALRITGTGVSFRQELDEYVWREPDLYLNAEFLARCNGLPVVWEHPASQELTQKEFEKRVIGSIVLPYLEGDEVWGIARIYDQDASLVMRKQPMSTSPAVVFRDPSVNRVRELGNGKHLLIEGEPSLLDHLAICELGVWDKGGTPTGVAVGEAELADSRIDLADAEARKDAAMPDDDLVYIKRAVDELDRCVGKLEKMVRTDREFASAGWTGRSGGGGGWDESAHPREGKGSSKGGQFTKGGGGGGGGAAAAAAKKGGKFVAQQAAKFTQHDYHILREGLHQPGSEPRKRLGGTLMTIGKSLPHLLKSHLKHEKDHAVHAAKALGCFTAPGCKPSPEQIKALKTFGMRILMSAGTMALTGDATGTVGHLAGALAHEVVNHVVLEHTAQLGAVMARLGISQMVKKSDQAGGDKDELSDEDYKALEAFIKALADAAATMEIPEDRVAELLAEQSSKGGQDDKKRSDADFKEGEHPRDPAGKFTAGGGSSPSRSKHITPDFRDITERQWEPEYVRHYNRHQAHIEAPEGGTTLHRHGGWKGPVFQVEEGGRVHRTGKFFPLPK